MPEWEQDPVAVKEWEGDPVAEPWQADPPAQESPIVASLIQKPAGSPEELSARNFAQQLGSQEHSSFWDNLTRPIEPVASWVTGMGAQDVAMRLLPETAKQTTVGKVAVGTQKAVDEAVKSFVSPLGIVTLGVGSLPKALQSAISAGFATHMATSLPEQTKLAVQAIKEGDTEKAAQYIAGTAITGTLVGLAGKHAVTSGKEALSAGKVEAAKVVGPATEAVVKAAEPAVEAPVPEPAIVPRETILESPKAEVEAPKAPFKVLEPEPSNKWIGTYDWRKSFAEASDIEVKIDWLRAVANNRGSKASAQDMADVLDRTEQLLKEQKHSRLANTLWDVAKNPASSIETGQRAKSLYDQFYTPEAEAVDIQPVAVKPAKAAKKAATEVKRVAEEQGPRDAKQIKEELIAEIQARLQKAPSEAVEGDKVTIEIPGDGTFTVKNNVEALTEMLERAKKIKTDAGKPTGVPKAAVKASAGAIRHFEGEAAKRAKQEAQPVGMGAATPAEFELSPKTPTGIKNATVDQERVKRGLPPAMEPARRSFGTVWDSAMARMDQDPGFPDRLIGELREKPRALTDVEDATILHRQIELQNEYGKATRDLAQAFDDGRLEDVADQKVRVATLSDQLLDLYNIGKAAGTETGRGLAARKMMAFEDFSLAKMELEKRAAKGGEQLTDAERAEVVRANAEIERTTKALEEHTAGAEERVRQRETDRVVTEAKASKEPVEPLADITGKLRDKFMAGEVEAITSLVQKLARYFVFQGVRERGALVEAVHGVIKDIDPTLTVRDTMDAISGYGRFKRLSKDEISVQLRDLKGQMQQVAKLEDMQANQPPRKTGTERRTPSDEERRLIRLVNEAKNKFQIPITDEATQLKSSLDTLKTRLRNQITDLEARIKNKDFEKRPKRFIQMDEAAQKLHFDAAKVKARWMEALMKDRLARRSLPAKIIGTVGEVLNTTRAVLTSLDLSAVLRQGGFIALGHPIRAAKAFPAMFRALRSEAGQHAVNQEILARKNYPLYQQSKLYLAEHGHKLSQMEEAYMSRWADKIPLVAGSQRAYVTFLNKLRADSFDAMANSLARDAELTPMEAKAIANYINVATGRGSLGATENAAVGLSTVFFAPRYVASRFQLLAGQPLYRGTGRTRTMIAKEYARYLTGVAVVYALGQLAGGEVETDPRSSDFGKLRFDNTRIDPLSGLQQVSVLTSRLGSGETKRLSGETVPIRGEVPFAGDDSADVMARFLRTKLSPVIGTGVNILSGTDVTGKEVTAGSTAEGLLVPLALQDIYKTMVEQGVPKGTAMAILSIFGMGLQTYDE